MGDQVVEDAGLAGEGAGYRISSSRPRCLTSWILRVTARTETGSGPPPTLSSVPAAHRPPAASACRITAYRTDDQSSFVAAAHRPLLCRARLLLLRAALCCAVSDPPLLVLCCVRPLPSVAPVWGRVRRRPLLSLRAPLLSCRAHFVLGTARGAVPHPSALVYRAPRCTTPSCQILRPSCTPPPAPPSCQILSHSCASRTSALVYCTPSSLHEWSTVRG